MGCKTSGVFDILALYRLDYYYYYFLTLGIYVPEGVLKIGNTK